MRLKYRNLFRELIVFVQIARVCSHMVIGCFHENIVIKNKF